MEGSIVVGDQMITKSNVAEGELSEVEVNMTATGSKGEDLIKLKSALPFQASAKVNGSGSTAGGASADSAKVSKGEELINESKSTSFQASTKANGADFTAGDASVDSTKKEGSPIREEGGDASADAKRTSRDVTFPQQLMDIIEKETANGSVTSSGDKVLEWMPNDDSFIIRDKHLLEEVVLPKYFKAMCKFMSVVRKLYRWGFRQVEKIMPGVYIFMHENFIRGDKKRCLLLKSVVKKPEKLATVQASKPKQGSTGNSEICNGATMNQNLLAGLSKSCLGGLHAQMSQLNPSFIPQAANRGLLNAQNLLGVQNSLQQHTGTSYHQGNFGNGNLSLTSDSSPFVEAASAQQKLNMANFLSNHQVAASANSLSFNNMISTPPKVGAAALQLQNGSQGFNGQGPNCQGFTQQDLYSNCSSLKPTLFSTVPSSNSNGNSVRAVNVNQNGMDPVVILAMQIMQSNRSLSPKTALELARNICE